MDYNLDALGPRNFEQLTQSLLTKALGTKVITFGDGPDGGREATWRGVARGLAGSDEWNGYGVLQAKYKTFTEDPTRNLVWLKSEVKKEIKAWTKPGTKRFEKPDYLVFATNVRLSAVPDNGKDEITSFISAELKALGLVVKGFRVTDYYDIASQLDGAEDIRRRYAAFLTTGDVIAKLLDQAEVSDKTLAQALAAYTARSLRDENLINLTQAGTAGDHPIGIDAVFVDLPSELPRQRWLVDADRNEDDVAEEDYDIAGLTFSVPESERRGVAAHLIHDYNLFSERVVDDEVNIHRSVLIGGPGQGKSTITQWLAQMYRGAFLKGSPIAKDADIGGILARIETRRDELKLPPIGARRWPVRVVLTDLADYLAKNSGHSLLHFIADRVSDRSSTSISSDMLRQWLTTYPWLMLIDGLDEVPASSNRDQVMTAIRDFFLDVTVIGGDVAAVATTRPQGYGDEFSPKEYRHFNLVPLQVEESLNYANGLVSIRLGAGTPAASKVIERLRRASHEEHTVRLFESPLQVTILEVLLEKLGKAPTDRSRLYSAYYAVISQREQEKSGALSDLLQRYESDVDYLHRRIGFELQQRGAAIGETSSSLTINEFNEFIVERFLDQGHDEQGVQALALEFSALVTDRLVFLARLQAERIGFELRSLQEFMASEYIINLPEPRVVPEIQKIATAPYWRNVVLFSIGSIFAHRDHLRAEVVLMCDALNEDSRASVMRLPGSMLAVDILRDGSCSSMPKYAQALARNTLKLASSPATDMMAMLDVLHSPDLLDIKWGWTEAISEASPHVWINRAVLLASMSRLDEDRSAQALSRLVDVVDDDIRRELVLYAWRSGDRYVGHAIAAHVFLCSPVRLFAETSSRFRREFNPRTESKYPAWMRSLYALEFDSPQATPEWSRDDAQPPALEARYSPLGAHEDAWSWLASLNSPAVEWLPLTIVARFALAPSLSTFADGLEAISDVPDNSLVTATPWPLIAMLRWLRGQGDHPSRPVAQPDLEQAHKLIVSGAFGSPSDWLAAQDRWGQLIPVDDQFMANVRPRATEPPLNAELSSAGVVPEAYRYVARGVEQEQATLEFIEKMLAQEDTNSLWFNLAAFLAGVIAGPDLWPIEAIDPQDTERVRDLIADALPRHMDEHSRWLSWLEIRPITHDSPSDNVLVQVGRQQKLAGRLSIEGVDVVLARAEAIIDQPENSFAITRIALASRPSVAFDLFKKWNSLDLEGAGRALVGILPEACRIFTMDETELWRGNADIDFLKVVDFKESSFGLLWFEALMADPANDAMADIGAVGARAVAGVAPGVAERWLAISRRIRARNEAAPV